MHCQAISKITSIKTLNDSNYDFIYSLSPNLLVDISALPCGEAVIATLIGDVLVTAVPGTEGVDG